jgi:hypothetical protein
MGRFLEAARRAVGSLKRSGYTYITLDLEGHGIDSMDEILKDWRLS